MVFAADDPVGSLGCAGHVEVAQGSIAKAMNPVEPGQHGLDQQFGLAVDVGRLEASGFGDRDGFGLAVDGCRRRKDDPAGAVGQNRLEEGQGGGGVVAKVDLRRFHGLAGFNEGGEVQDSVERGPGIGGGYEKILEGLPVGQVSLDKLHARGEELAAAMAQIIEYNRIVALRG